MSRSPSPVAFVKPMIQSQTPQYPYQRQANVGPVTAEALPLVQPKLPPQLHSYYSSQQQQQTEKVTPQIVDNTQTMKHNEQDDRPFDPNLVCPMCKQQF